MRYFRLSIMFIVCVCLFCIVSSADDVLTDDEINASYAATLGEEYEPVSEPIEDELDPDQSSTAGSSPEDPLYVQIETGVLPEDTTVYADDGVITLDDNSSGTFSLMAPVEPDDTTGVKSALLSVIGSYDPIVATWQNSNGYTSYEVQIDYVWLVSAAFLLVTLVLVFRIWGVVLSRV